MNEKLQSFKKQEEVLLTQHRETTEAVLKKRTKEVEEMIDQWRVDADKKSHNMFETYMLRVEQRLRDTQKTVNDRVERLDLFVDSLRNAVLDDGN